MCPEHDKTTQGSRNGVLITGDVSANAAPGAPPVASLAVTSPTGAGPAKGTVHSDTGQSPSAREAQFLDSLIGFARQRQAEHWSGTLATFLETIVRAEPQRATRTSHQYVWDMLRSQGEEGANGILRCALLSSELLADS